MKYLVNKKNKKIFNCIIPRYENLAVYSTKEQRIGTWIDGKPLYRKVWQVPVTDDGQAHVIDLNINIDKVVNISGCLYNDNLNIPLNMYNDGGYCYVYFLAYSNSIQYRVNAEWAKNMFLILEYTKK